MPRSRRTLSVDGALNKLFDASKLSSQRGHVKPGEQNRIHEALSLLANGCTDIPLGARARSTYLHFLKDIERTSGIRMVILCAFGLGKAAISLLAERARLDLSSKISRGSGKLDNEVLWALAKGYPTKCKERTSRWVCSINRCTDISPTKPTSGNQESDRQLSWANSKAPFAETQETQQNESGIPTIPLQYLTRING